MFKCVLNQKVYTYWCLSTYKFFFNKNKIRVSQFTHVHADFEVTQIHVFRKAFGEKIIFVGCHFHYLRALYNKLKLSGLMENKFRKFNISLIVILRYVPCLHIDLITKFFITFKEYFITSIVSGDIPEKARGKYTNFLDYFEKNWLRYKQL